MSSKQIKYINSEEIFTNVMDVVMPDRDKSDNPKEISNRLKMTKLVCGRLFSKFLDTSISIFKKKNAGLVLGSNVFFHINKDRIQPAVRAKIVLVDKDIKENEEEYKEMFKLDEFKYKEDVEDNYKFKLYNTSSSDHRPPSETEEFSIEDVIYVQTKFIEDNKLEDKYFDIMATYLSGLLEYTDHILRDTTASVEEFSGPNKVRPNFVITPVIEDHLTKYFIFNKF